MVKTTLKIDGMMCPMCEAHINDTVRSACEIRSVKSSHSKGTAETISDSPLDEAVPKEAIGKTGYKVLNIQSTPYEKKRFSIFGR